MKTSLRPRRSQQTESNKVGTPMKTKLAVATIIGPILCGTLGCALSSRNASPAPTEKPSFGPIVETVVNGERPGATNFLIDFDSGSVGPARSPRGSDMPEYRAVYVLCESSQGYVDATGDTYSRGLWAAEGTMAVLVDSEAWSSFTASWDLRTTSVA
jgi:hypothetical protein